MYLGDKTIRFSFYFLLFFSVIQLVLITSILNKGKNIKKISLENEEQKLLKNKINDQII